MERRAHNTRLERRAFAGMEGNEPVSVVASCLCLKLRMVARTTAILYDKSLQPVGLSSSQFSALRNIYRFAPRGVSELAKVMLLERTTLTRNLELLRAQQLLEMQVSASDSRVFTPVLTSRGIDVLKAAVPRWRTAQRRFFGGLGAPGWAELLSTLRAAAAINEQAPHRLYVGDPDPKWREMKEVPGLELLDTQRCANSTLRGAARYITREYDGVLRPLGIKSTQFHVLAAIEENPRSRPLDLARLLSLDQTSTTLAVSSMRRANWIDAKMAGSQDPNEVEPRSVALTPNGRAILSKARPLWGQIQSAKVGPGSDEALLKWTAAIDDALVAALKAQV